MICTLSKKNADFKVPTAYFSMKPNKDFLQMGKLSTLIIFSIDSVSLAYIRKTDYKISFPDSLLLKPDFQGDFAIL